MNLDTLLSTFMPVPAELRLRPPEVTLVTDDSRKVIPGAMFVARPGTNADGRAFVSDAVARGAAVILHAGPDPCAGIAGAERVVRVAVPAGTEIGRFTCLLADCFEGSPSHWLDVVGVTGTNGKTTITFLVQQFMNAHAPRCGVIGTVVIDDGARAEPASLTTPGGADVSAALGRMVRNGCRSCAIEVSSHALDQGRAGALRFRVGIFTNLTGDHLDYHGTMERYAAAKARLFAMLDAGGTAVVNADDPWHARMIEGCPARVLRCRVVGGGSRGAGGPGAAPGSSECVATVHESRLGWQDTTFAGPWGGIRVRLPVVGRHNAMNALQAAAAAWALGVPASVLERVLGACKAPPGRLEPVTGPADPFAVLVDYAHTDDALLNVLSALRPLVGEGGRLVTVFGCGGDRDRTKRPRMMRVACERSDRVVVTSDNPRTEDPAAIIAEVVAGRPEACAAEVVQEADRARAIELAVGDARPGDIVLIAGKGHEDYQITGTEKRAFDDRRVARAALESRAAPVAACA